MKFLGQGFQKLEHEQDKYTHVDRHTHAHGHTDKQTDKRDREISHLAAVNNTRRMKYIISMEYNV